MKKLILLSTLLILACKHNENTPSKELKFNPDIELISAKASCGICMFEMDGEKCELAVDIKGYKYYVSGAHIDSFGDAHSENGFCNAILDADIQGVIINNKFHLTYFKFN
jgi:hypothetical protein